MIPACDLARGSECVSRSFPTNSLRAKRFYRSINA
jgi:hypothetical protein